MHVIHEAVADSSAAFAAQIESHRSYLMRTARGKLREPTDAEDVVQETIIAAWNGRNGFRGQSALRTWLFGILSHKIVDQIRDRQRHPALSLDALDAILVDDDDMDSLPGAATPSAATTYEQRRLCTEVMDELEAFSPKAAQIFVMREIEGHDTGVICRRLKVSTANCYVLLHRARRFLLSRGDAMAGSDQRRNATRCCISTRIPILSPIA